MRRWGRGGTQRPRNCETDERWCQKKSKMRIFGVFLYLCVCVCDKNDFVLALQSLQNFLNSLNLTCFAISHFPKTSKTTQPIFSLFHQKIWKSWKYSQIYEEIVHFIVLMISQKITQHDEPTNENTIISLSQPLYLVLVKCKHFSPSN